MTAEPPAEIQGLEAYAPAPEGMVLPEWVVREGNLWARIDGTCRPVHVDDAAAGRLAITTCEAPPLACGVTVTASDELHPTATWCRNGHDEAAGRIEPSTSFLMHADDERVSYAVSVPLTVVPIGLHGESHRCTAKSQREVDARLKEIGLDILDPIMRNPLNPDVDPGQRTCVHADGFRVVESHGKSPYAFMETVPPAQLPGRVDCMEPCPPDALVDQYWHRVQDIENRRFVAADRPGLELFRTDAACRARGGAGPSPLPPDLCTTLGARLTDARP